MELRLKILSYKTLWLNLIRLMVFNGLRVPNVLISLQPHSKDHTGTRFHIFPDVSLCRYSKVLLIDNRWNTDRPFLVTPFSQPMSGCLLSVFEETLSWLRLSSLSQTSYVFIYSIHDVPRHSTSLTGLFDSSYGPRSLSG